MKTSEGIEWWRFVVIGAVSWGTLGLLVVLTVNRRVWETAIAGVIGIPVSLLVAWFMLWSRRPRGD